MFLRKNVEKEFDQLSLMKSALTIFVETNTGSTFSVLTLEVKPPIFCKTETALSLQGKIQYGYYFASRIILQI